MYVGETEFLFKRLTQHIRGKGGKNTHVHVPKKLIGLYRLNDNQSFYQYISAKKRGISIKDTVETWAELGDNLFIENRFTERLLWERRNNHEYGTGNEWYRIRGGKYTRENLDESMEIARTMCQRPNRIPGTLSLQTPVDNFIEDQVVDRPLCQCGMPCEVKIKDKKLIYFVCALKNVFENLRNGIQSRGIQVGTGCNFWKVFEEVLYSPDKYPECLISDEYLAT